MKVLVLGGGGREHVLAWKLSLSPRVDEVWCAPGNAGIARDVRTTPINADSEDGIAEAIRFARDRGIDLTVVGPEAPLVLGVVDRFEEAGLRIFGPNRAAAQLEGSKCFTKEFLARHGIPTASFHVFDEVEAARRHVATRGVPVVVKAEGLAAGKGVFVARTTDEALAAVETIMVERKFGAAGDRLIVEDFLPGFELTLIVLTDGKTAVPLETAQDYKPVFNGNTGPNTGGMGSYSPHVPLDDGLISQALERIIQPTLAGLERDGIEYRGALYAGLMITSKGPSLLEYNVRFGDPDVQSILFRLETDLLDVIEACVDGRLDEVTPRWNPGTAICVIGASPGYPGRYEKGRVIEGLEESAREAEARGDRVKVFFAGAGADAEGRLVTSGGRVLGVTALGDTLDGARECAYRHLRKVGFDGMHARDDIGVPIRVGS